MSHRMPIVLAVAFLLSLAFPATAQEEFVCTAEQAAGFKYSDFRDRWVDTEFKTRGRQYVIAFGEDGVTVNQVGGAGAKFVCASGFDADSGALDCVGNDGHFRANNINRRFLRSHVKGYVEVLKEGPDAELASNTPMIEIGRCEPYQ